MPRVVSLIASATEIVCALGCEEMLVGRSHECDYPPTVRRLPVCTEPRVDVAGSSADIDRAVKSAVQDHLSVYQVHGELLKELRPDVIITQAQCEVCAVSQRDMEQAVRQWLDPGICIVTLLPNALDDVWKDMARVAEALQVPERGRQLVERLRGRMVEIAARAERLPKRPRTACIEWIEPLMAAGNWVPELVALAGGTNLFGQAGQHAPWLTWEQLRDQNPEVMVVMPCGWDIERSRPEMKSLSGRPGWSGLRAVQNKRVFLADGNRFFNRPGPRLVESLEILAEILHPEAFSFGHEGAGWQPLE